MDPATGHDVGGMGPGWVGGLGGRPRLEDVAVRAGVSLKQASRAINGEPGVSHATSERVLRAAQELGFRPNHAARSLARGGRSGLVGVLVPKIAEAATARMVGAIERELTGRDLALLVASHHDDAVLQHGLATTLIGRRVDALILMPAPGAAAYLGADLSRGLVVVGLVRPIDGVATDTVLAGVKATPSAHIGRVAAAVALERLGGLQDPPRRLIVPVGEGAGAHRGR